MNSDRCAVTESLNKYLDEEDNRIAEIDDLESVIESVISDFQEMAKEDSFEDAFAWLAGSFQDEATDNAILKIINKSNKNDYFDILFETKAKEIIEGRE